MKNKVDRRDLSELRNEVDLLSLRLDELDKCDPGTIGQMQSRISRIEELLGETKRVLTAAETAAFQNRRSPPLPYEQEAVLRTQQADRVDFEPD